MTKTATQNNWEETTIGHLVQKDILFAPVDGNHGEIHPKGEDFVEKGVPFIMASDLAYGTSVSKRQYFKIS
jgi:type I restriction enzyme S subunit